MTRWAPLSSLRLRASLIVLTLTAVACGAPPDERRPNATDAGTAPGSPSPARHATRIVSLVPSVTESLFAIGSGPQVVGVSSFDTYPPEVATLPKVGALVDPDSERVLALRPDLVVVYTSQHDEQRRFESAGVRTYEYRHGGIDVVLATIIDLGTLTGRDTRATALASEIRGHLARVAERVRNRPRPRTLLVFDRAPGTLQGLYASGGVGFLHEMLTAAGGENVFGDVPRESVQPSHELLLTRAPDVVIEISALPRHEAQAAQDREAWSALSSVPAVRAGRVFLLTGDDLVVPGPRIAHATERLARTLHPDVFR